MKIIITTKLKRSIIILLFAFSLLFGMLDGVQGVGRQTSPTKTQPHANTESRSSPRQRRQEGSMDFQTKILLVSFSIFILVFVVILLIIGHFTWFADIRRKLEEEWAEELKLEREKLAAQMILAEMTNPFEDQQTAQTTILEDQNSIDDDNVYFRKDSVDSSGCARGRCVPPHHSILCPNNPNIPSLTDPIFHSSHDDPIEYRYNTRPSTTEWMNLESCVKISEPVPRRERGDYHYNQNSIFMMPRSPMTPITPEPIDQQDIELGTLTKRDSFKSSSHAILSPEMKFDLSKLDMF